MKTNTDQSSTFLHSKESFETYEIVENKSLGGNEFRHLVVSGALLSFTQFENVIFDSCVFFASKLENCSFKNCSFTNCKFQFSSLEHCHFANTSLYNCSWEASPMNKTNFFECHMDHKTSHHIIRGNNRITLDPAYAMAA